MRYLKYHSFILPCISRWIFHPVRSMVFWCAKHKSEHFHHFNSFINRNGTRLFIYFWIFMNIESWIIYIYIWESEKESIILVYFSESKKSNAHLSISSQIINLKNRKAMILWENTNIQERKEKLIVKFFLLQPMHWNQFEIFHIPTSNILSLKKSRRISLTCRFWWILNPCLVWIRVSRLSLFGCFVLKVCNNKMNEILEINMGMRMSNMKNRNKGRDENRERKKKNQNMYKTPWWNKIQPQY